MVTELTNVRPYAPSHVNHEKLLKEWGDYKDLVGLEGDIVVGEMTPVYGGRMDPERGIQNAIANVEIVRIKREENLRLFHELIGQKRQNG